MGGWSDDSISQRRKARQRRAKKRAVIGGMALLLTCAVAVVAWQISRAGRPAARDGKVSEASSVSASSVPKTATDMLRQFSPSARVVSAERVSVRGELGATAYDYAKDFERMSDDLERQGVTRDSVARGPRVKRPPPPQSGAPLPVVHVNGAYMAVVETPAGRERWFFIMGEDGGVALGGPVFSADWTEDVRSIVLPASR